MNKPRLNLHHLPTSYLRFFSRKPTNFVVVLVPNPYNSFRKTTARRLIEYIPFIITSTNVRLKTILGLCTGLKDMYGAINEVAANLFLRIKRNRASTRIVSYPHLRKEFIFVSKSNDRNNLLAVPWSTVGRTK